MTAFDDMMLEFAIEVGPDGPPSLVQFGMFVDRYPDLDVDLIELAAATYPDEWGELRDLVIYADGRCLLPGVEKRRLDAAKRGAAVGKEKK
jgi:hypothetical protein